MTDGRLGILEIGIAAQNDEMAGKTILPCLADRIQTIQAGHTDIHQDKIRA